MNSRTITPLELGILLHCYCRPVQDPSHETGVHREALERFVDLDLVYWAAEDGGYWKTTAKGTAWVRMILSTPLPRQAWLDEQGREVHV